MQFCGKSLLNDIKVCFVLSLLTFRLFNFLHLKEPSAIFIRYLEIHTCPKKLFASLITSFQSSTDLNVPSFIRFCTSPGQTMSNNEHLQRSLTNLSDFHPILPNLLLISEECETNFLLMLMVFFSSKHR